MISPLLPLLATLLASPATLVGTVLTEGRAGSSPQLPGQGPQPFAMAILSPQLELWLRDERADARVAYLPRLVWQTPNQLGYEARPLVLHQASVVLAGRLSRTTDGTLGAFGSIGQPDYTVLPQLIAPGQAALPTAQTIMTGRGNAAVQNRVTRRLRLTLAAAFSYFEVLNAPPPSMMAPPPGTPQFFSPRQTAFAVIPGTIYALTRNDDLLLTSAVTYGSYGRDIAIASIAPQVMWQARRPPAGDEMRIAVGLSYARDEGAGSALGEDRSAFLPMGSIEVVHGMLIEESRALRARARFMVEQYVDPILAVSGPRATTSGEVMLTLPPSWAVGIQADFSASLRTTTLPMNNPDETAFAVRLPIRHRFSSNAFLEGGGVWSDRAPALAAPDFRFHQRQLWAYVAFTLTTRDVSPWSIR